MPQCAFLLLALLAIGVPLLGGETVQEIADRVVFARGGRAKLQSIQTERMSGQVLADSQRGSFVMDVKRPNKVRLEITIGPTTIVKSYDGKTGWKKNSSSQNDPERLQDAEARELLGDTDIDGPFLDFASKGTKIEIIDKELLGSSLVWKLSVTPKNGPAFYYYVESTGYLVLLREQVQANGAQPDILRQFYQDFQRVEYVTFPFVVVAETKISGEPVYLRCEKIELNTPEPDTRFALVSAPAK